MGIGCTCCMGNAFYEMKELSKQDEEQLTFANLWVNGNYKHYLDNIVPLYNQYELVLVCNKKASLEKLPFKVSKDFRIGTNAWKNDYDIVREMQRYIAGKEKLLILFAAGPFGNILAYHLHEINTENTYLDIGSTLDPFLFDGELGKTRGYLKGLSTLNKMCVW